MTPREIAAAMSGRQRARLEYVANFETPDFGVIIGIPTGESFLRRGLVERAPRRSFARTTGLCVRTTQLGRDVIAAINNEKARTHELG